MSSGRSATENENDGAPVSASTVMVGLTFRSPKIRSRSRGAQQRRGDVVVDRARELLGQLGRRRRRHQVDAGDEHLLAHAAPAPRANERGLAVAPRGEDHHVLPVADVGAQLGDLRLAVGERLVERERAEPERVDVCHAGQRNADLRNALGDRGGRAVSASSSYQE